MSQSNEILIPRAVLKDVYTYLQEFAEILSGGDCDLLDGSHRMYVRVVALIEELETAMKE